MSQPALKSSGKNNFRQYQNLSKTSPEEYVYKFTPRELKLNWLTLRFSGMACHGSTEHLLGNRFFKSFYRSIYYLVVRILTNNDNIQLVLHNFYLCPFLFIFKYIKK